MPDLNEIECGQLCQSTIESLYEATGGLQHFPGLLKKIIKNRAWEKRICKGRVIELSGLRQLITEKPIKGWGEDPKKVEAVIKDDPEALTLYREAMKAQGNNQFSKCNNVTLANSQGEGTGNSRAYSLARVQKECDSETVKKVMTGKMSPNAALVKNGIRENRQVYINKDPRKTASKLRDQFGDEFAKELAQYLLNQI